MCDRCTRYVPLLDELCPVSRTIPSDHEDGGTFCGDRLTQSPRPGFHPLPPSDSALFRRAWSCDHRLSVLPMCFDVPSYPRLTLLSMLLFEMLLKLEPQKMSLALGPC